MALSDIFIRQIKPSGAKHFYGGGLYLFVKGQGRYWRLDYRYLIKTHKTLSGHLSRGVAGRGAQAARRCARAAR